MGPSTSPVAESEKDDKMPKPKGASVSLPQHSYWYDFWMFVLFDVAFFLFMYYVVP